MTDVFQPAPAQQGSGSTSHQPAWNSSSTAGLDVSRNFLAGDEGGRQQIQSSAHVAVPAGIGGGIPRAELSSSSWRREDLSNQPQLARLQGTRSTLLPSRLQRPSSHTCLTAAVTASQAPGWAVETVAGVPNDTEIGVPSPRVPLSSALGQAASEELGNVGIAGMGAALGVGAGSGQGAAWEGSRSGAAGGLALSSAGSVHFSAQGGAAGGVVPQQPFPAEGGARDERYGQLPFAAVGGNGGGDNEGEDDGESDGAPIPIPIPDGLSLNKTSWCCGRKETIRSICGECKKRWHCHIAHGLIDMDKDRFTCCFCDSIRATSGCRCHK